MTRPRVAHHPARHPFVDHLGGEPVDVDVWDVASLSAADVDVVHLHFGFEHIEPARLEVWVAELADAGIALVHTVHDLDNPHLVDQRPHHERLRILVAACSAVLTLTEWAAERVWRTYGRPPVVAEHPPIVPAGVGVDLRQRASGRAGVYVHGATLRPNLDLDLVEALSPSAARWGGMRVHVRSGAARTPELRAQVGRITRAGAAVECGPRLGDDELWDRIRSARVLLLPYRWGTHSGLLEAATDLGTPVVAPADGGYGDQGAVTYLPGHAADALDRASAAAPMIDHHLRTDRYRRSRDAHTDVYARKVAR